MKDTVQTIHFLDGGSVVTIDVENDKATLIFEHSHKDEMFTIELDRSVLEGKSDIDAANKLVEIVNAFVGKFDELRS